MEEITSSVYILTDNANRILRIEGEYTLPSDLDGWVLVEEGAPCDRLNLAQTHYLQKPITEEHGVPRYKWYRKKIVERSAEEIEADIPAPAPDDTLDALMLDIMADHEERLCMIELGLI